MHAGGFVTQKRRSPIGLGGAIAIHGVVIAVYLLTPKEVFEHLPPVITLGRNIALEQKPDPLPPADKKKPETPTEIVTPKSEIPTLTDGPRLDSVAEQDIKLVNLPPLDDLAKPTLPTITEPILADARPDPRYMRDFQPDYPTNLQRLGLEGSVTVRVKIGADGRVKAVQLISAAHDDFFKATERQALRYWRFKPATRDREPVESWRNMTVHFQLEG